MEEAAWKAVGGNSSLSRTTTSWDFGRFMRTSSTTAPLVEHVTDDKELANDELGATATPVLSGSTDEPVFDPDLEMDDEPPVFEQLHVDETRVIPITPLENKEPVGGTPVRQLKGEQIDSCLDGHSATRAEWPDQFLIFQTRKPGLCVCHGFMAFKPLLTLTCAKPRLRHGEPRSAHASIPAGAPILARNVPEHLDSTITEQSQRLSIPTDFNPRVFSGASRNAIQLARSLEFDRDPLAHKVSNLGVVCRECDRPISKNEWRRHCRVIHKRFEYGDEISFKNPLN